MIALGAPGAVTTTTWYGPLPSMSRLALLPIPHPHLLLFLLFALVLEKQSARTTLPVSGLVYFLGPAFAPSNKNSAREMADTVQMFFVGISVKRMSIS